MALSHLLILFVAFLNCFEENDGASLSTLVGANNVPPSVKGVQKRIDYFNQMTGRPQTFTGVTPVDVVVGPVGSYWSQEGYVIKDNHYTQLFGKKGSFKDHSKRMRHVDIRIHGNTIIFIRNRARRNLNLPLAQI